MFKKAFRAVGKFFSNIAKKIVNFFSTAFSAFVIILAFVPGLNLFAMAMWACLIAMVAVGFDLEWLQIAIAVVAAVITAYNVVFNFDSVVNSLADFLPSSAIDLIIQNSGVARLMMLAVNVFWTTAYVTSVNEGISIGEALERTAYDLGSTIGGIGGGAIGGMVDGVTDGVFSSSVLGWVFAAGAIYVGYKVLSGDSDGVTIQTQEART